MKYVCILVLIALMPYASYAYEINKAPHLASLVRTDRAPRSWKTLWLVPGKPKFYYYEWVEMDGSIATKVETSPIKGIPDRRIFSDSHPNLNLILVPVQFVGVGTAIGLGAAKL